MTNNNTSLENMEDLYGGHVFENEGLLRKAIINSGDKDLLNAYESGEHVVKFTGFDELTYWLNSFVDKVDEETCNKVTLKINILTGVPDDEEGESNFWIEKPLNGIVDYLERLDERTTRYPLEFIAEYLKSNEGEIFESECDVIRLHGGSYYEEITNFGQSLLIEGYVPELENLLMENPTLEVDYYALGMKELENYRETKHYAYREV